MSNYDIEKYAANEALGTILCNPEDTTYAEFFDALWADPQGYVDYDKYTPWEPFSDMNNAALLELLENFKKQFVVYGWRIIQHVIAVDEDNAWAKR